VVTFLEKGSRGPKRGGNLFPDGKLSHSFCKFLVIQNASAPELNERKPTHAFGPSFITGPLTIVQADFESPESRRNTSRFVAMLKAHCIAHSGLYAHLAGDWFTQPTHQTGVNRGEYFFGNFSCNFHSRSLL
jgi:hypothetical protein